ncbi:MAG: Serine/threonine protein kinase [Polyangiaceae bacterium]|nr:Serine/threonine protein kinase [Polyangiaceae bacterium]
MSAAPQPNAVSILDGKYALIRQLGSGGTGTVYEAENLIVGKKVAIKVMKAEAFAEPNSQERFVTEARAAARISHANVVDIHDLGVTKQGVPYLVMELLRGETLQDVIDTRGPLNAGYACELFMQVLAGLSAAHAQGIIHCHLKPGNVLVTHPRPDRPLVKVVDFGIARGVEVAQSRDAVVMGAPVYLSPEQVTGDPVDFRSDIYQACAMLFAMLAGTDPFEGTTPRDVMKLVAKGRCKDLSALVPELPSELLQVVVDGMALRPQDRIQSAEELAERLRPFAGSAQFVSLVPQGFGSLGRAIPLIVGPTPERDRASAMPDVRMPNSVIPVNMPRVARVRDSLLMSPRIPRAPSTPKLKMGQDFMPMPGDPEYDQLQETRREQTHVPRRGSHFRRDLVPALVATGIGFGLGVVMAWSAGLI